MKLSHKEKEWNIFNYQQVIDLLVVQFIFSFNEIINEN